MERRDAFLTGLVLAVCSGLIAAVVLFARDDQAELTLNAETPDAGTLPPPAGAGSDPDRDAGDAAGSDDLETFVDESIEFIEATRNGEFVTRPEVLILAEEDFVARVAADFEEDFGENPEDVAMYNAIYRSLGLIGVDDDIDEILRLFGEAGILGFYDPATDELVVRQPDELSLLTKSTIVHELVHAFDDQNFDLDRPDYEDRTDEIPWTFRAVAEGSASWVEAQWQDRLSGSELDDLRAEELGFGDPTLFYRFEPAFLILELAPYTYGEPFVEEIVEDSGTAALDDAFVTPPETSEQVISPDAYLDGEGPRAVPTPPADGDVVFEGVGGEALVASLFEGNFVFDPIDWEGDRLVVWTEGPASCVRWDLQSSDASGLEGLADGFESWADQVGSATVTSVDDDTIRVDRCVG